MSQELLEAVNASKEALDAWCKWEADVIYNADWSSGTAHLTQAHHDALVEVAEKRLKAMSLIQIAQTGEPIF
jgi:hypothetical protein